jgi:hypothetical protein
MLTKNLWLVHRKHIPVLKNELVQKVLPSWCHLHAMWFSLVGHSRTLQKYFFPHCDPCIVVYIIFLRFEVLTAVINEDFYLLGRNAV